MEREEAIEKLVDQMIKLQEMVKKADLPIELADSIRKACNKSIKGKDLDEVVDALLIVAYEASRQRVNNSFKNEDIRFITEYMKRRANFLFEAFSSSLCLYAIMQKLDINKTK